MSSETTEMPPRRLTSSQQAFSGAMAGLISRLVIAPLDVVKIRLQVWAFISVSMIITFQLQTHRVGAPIQPNPTAATTSTTTTPTIKYRTIWQSWRTIVHEEGWTSLWKGNIAAEFLYLGYGASQFLFYNELQRVATPWRTVTGSNQTVLDMLCGAVAGVGATVVTYPLDLLRTRFAAQGEPRVNTSRSTMAGWITAS